MYVQLQVITYILYTSSELLCLCHCGDVYVVAQYINCIFTVLPWCCICMRILCHHGDVCGCTVNCIFTVSPWCCMCMRILCHHGDVCGCTVNCILTVSPWCCMCMRILCHHGDICGCTVIAFLLYHHGDTQ